MNAFMKKAVELALTNVEEGGQPFGAVLVKDNKVIAEGVNEIHKDYDVSGHAELLAIRRAQQALRTNNLEACTIYASGEPCPMCLAAAYFAGIKTIYYSGSIEEAKRVGLGMSSFIYNEIAGLKEDRSIEMLQVSLDEGMSDPFLKWKNK